jgi:hypothetical protein
MRSAAARISMMSNEQKDDLRDEIKTHLGTIGLNLKTLKMMKKLDAFTLEVRFTKIICNLVPRASGSHARCCVSLAALRSSVLTRRNAGTGDEIE